MSAETVAREVSMWIIRMDARFGSWVFDHDAPTKKWDWGQALCRERYGLDWMEASPDTPTEADLRRAVEWEKGDWPAWAWTLQHNPPSAKEATP